eukprot:g4431.t1
MTSTSARYLLQRLNFALEIAYKRILAPQSSLLAAYSDALEQGTKAFTQELTEVIYLSGPSMTPTLNPNGEKDRDAVDRLLLRLIPLPSVRSIHVFDVVAFDSPYRFGDNQTVLVRRVAALPGHQMISDSVVLEPFVIPPDHCWVLADNSKLEPSEVVDSRFFGPLPLENIRGRVIYNGYNKQDHGRVLNSAKSRLVDEAVLKYELDLDRMFD